VAGAGVTTAPEAGPVGAAETGEGAGSLRGFSLNFDPGSAAARAAATCAVGGSVDAGAGLGKTVAAGGAGSAAVGVAEAVGAGSGSLGLNRIAGAAAGVAGVEVGGGFASGCAGGGDSAAAGLAAERRGLRRTFGAESAGGAGSAAVGFGGVDTSAGVAEADESVGDWAGAGFARGFRRRTGWGFCSSLMGREKGHCARRYSKNPTSGRTLRRASSHRSGPENFHSRSGPRLFTVPRSYPMKKALILSLLVASLPLVSGCGMFSKKPRAKESTAIAGEVEATFRQRWVEKRSGELVAQGLAADAARAQAGREFDERYQFGLKSQR